VLDRGFALVRDADGSIVRNASEVEPSEVLHLRLARGAVSARVEEVLETEEGNREQDDSKES
jgi:exodeoxyribonuclease VII large subunit